MGVLTALTGPSVYLNSRTICKTGIHFIFMAKQGNDFGHGALVYGFEQVPIMLQYLYDEVLLLWCAIVSEL